MKANVGTIDKIVRLVLGLALISLVFVGPKTNWGWIGAIFVVTSLISFCPLYRLIGFSSKNADTAEQ